MCLTPAEKEAFSTCMVQQAIRSFSTAEKHSAGRARLVACASWPDSFQPNMYRSLNSAWQKSE